MHTRPRLPLIALILAVVMAGSGSLAGPVSALRGPTGLDPWPWMQLAALVNTLGGLMGMQALIDLLVGPAQIDNGTDGRLTVLLVGSDYRPRLAGYGERLDSIMIMSIDGAKRISAISLPRDVGNVPIAPGVTYKPKINGLFKYFKQQAAGSREVALENFRAAIAYALQIQIDYVGYIRFTGFESLVSEVGGVPTPVLYNIYDKGITDERAPNHKGAKFVQSPSTLMVGSDAPLCYGTTDPAAWTSVPNCTRALLYVRSRHGPGNNDWRRARRQQNFVFAAIQRVVSRGDGENLEALRTAALGNPTDVYTTLPLGPSDVTYLFSLLSGATMANQAILAPPKYAFTVPGTFKQELRIDEVRALTAAWFGTPGLAN